MKLYRQNAIRIILFALIPIFVASIINLLMLYRTEIRSIHSEIEDRSESVLTFLDGQLKTADRVVNNKRIDKVFAVSEQTNAQTCFYPIVQRLQQDSIWLSFFDQVAYFNTENGMIYGKKNACHVDEYLCTSPLQKTKYYATDALFLDSRDYAALMKENNSVRAMRVDIQSASGKVPGILFAYPLELSDQGKPHSYMLFSIDDEKLRRIIPMEKGVRCELKYNDILIYASDMDVETEASGRKIFDRFDSVTQKSGALRMEWTVGGGYIFDKIISVTSMQALVFFIVTALCVLLLQYVVHKWYEPVQDLIDKLPDRKLMEENDDTWQYINNTVEKIIEYNKEYARTVKDTWHDKRVFEIIVNGLKRDSPEYKLALDEGVRVDAAFFACLSLEDVEDNFPIYDWLTNSKRRKQNGFFIYFCYILQSRYLFLLATMGSRKELETVLSELTDGVPEDMVRKGIVVDRVEDIRLSYLSLHRIRDERSAGQRTEDPSSLDLELHAEGKQNFYRTPKMIMQYIRDHYKDADFSIKGMAIDFGTSTSNLSHQFRSLTGKSLSQFVEELRIAYAITLLNTDMKIKDIARECGYSTSISFTEAFKRIKHVTPRYYRILEAEERRSI